nr:unnamed protein product [Callosobruchus analis]
MKYKETAAQVRRYYKNHRKTEFQKFCSNLNRETPITKIWSTVRKFSNSQTSKPHRTEEEEHLADILNKLTQSDITTNIRELTGNTNNTSTFKNIELEELKVIMKNKKESAPGKDEISYSFLKNTTEDHLQTLCGIYNKILQGDIETPEDWKDQLEQLNPPEISVLQYADHILIISKSTNLSSCISNIQIATNRINNMLQELGLPISTHKTKGMIFSKCNIRNTPNQIQINNTPIE